jgi:hypothetical protein
MAANWGNKSFSEIKPFNEMVLATGMHDYGWHEWDSAPELDERTGKVANFVELDYNRHTKFYANGVAKVRELDPYAGLMDIMHAIGLYTRRYGFYPNMPNANSHAPVKEFVARHKAMREDVIRELQAGSLREYANEEYIWHNYKLLQVFDVLSLYLCWMLKPQFRISPVPTRLGEREEELVVTKVDDSRIRVKPYPFKTDHLRVSVPSRALFDRVFKTNQALRKAYYEARKEVLNFEIVS